jgi:prolyl 4-hydroxylase
LLFTTSTNTSTSTSTSTRTLQLEVRNRVGLGVGSDDVVDGEDVYLLPGGVEWIWPADNTQVTLPDMNNMRLIPISTHPRVFLVHDFLSLKEVGELLGAVVTGDVDLKPGRVGLGSAGNRTSYVGVDKGPSHFQTIKRRAAQLLRIPYGLKTTEGVSLQRYQTGQAYGLHHDPVPLPSSGDGSRFNSSFPNSNPKVGGSNRYATVQLYLSDVDVGGETVFAHAPGHGTVSVFRQNFALKDAIGSHACSLEALACM